MSRPVIVVGDRTSHGGVVLTGSPFSDIDGKAIARIGDKVTCPKKGHGSVTTIVTGDVTDIIDGSPIARHGDRTACGAMLISSQMLVYVDNENDSGTKGTTQSSQAELSSLANTNDPLAHENVYDEQAQLVSLPIEGVPYYVETKDGRVFTGKTGADGLIPRIDTYGEDAYAVYWGDDALAKTEGAEV
jgi:uncharacterized Zn-binding protein involved in type VI secretion